MGKTLLSLVALTALTNVEHNGVLYGPGQLAGTDFEVAHADAAPLLQVNAVKLFDPSTAVADSRSVSDVEAVAERAAAALIAANEAFAAARREAETAAQAQAKADTDAQKVAGDRAQLDADIQAFEEAKAAAAEAAAAKTAKK